MPQLIWDKAKKKAVPKDTYVAPIGPQDLPQSDELTTLKAEADALGIKYHWNIGADKLRELIREHKESQG